MRFFVFRWLRPSNPFFCAIFLGFFLSTVSPVVGAKDLHKFGLKVNQQAPSIKTKDIHGKPFNLAQSYKKGPVVLIFYRGGW